MYDMQLYLFTYIYVKVVFKVKKSGNHTISY